MQVTSQIRNITNLLRTSNREEKNANNFICRKDEKKNVNSC